MVCWKKFSTLAACYDWSDDEIFFSGVERYLAIFPAGNIVIDSHNCTIENALNLSSGFIEWSCTQCRIQRFFGHTVFLKLKIGYIVPTPPPSNPNCCSWGWVQKYLILNAFGGGYLTMFHSVFTWNIMRKELHKSFGRTYLSNGTKVHLDAVWVVITTTSRH